MILTRHNVFAIKDISLILISIIFLCLSCSVLNNGDDDNAGIASESENESNIEIDRKDNAKISSEKTSVKDILTESFSEFTTTSVLCDDVVGPNCRKLRLGDDYLTISSPAKGYLYSCT